MTVGVPVRIQPSAQLLCHGRLLRGVQRGEGEWALGAAPAVRLHAHLRMDPSDTQPLQRVLVEKSDAEPLRPPGFIKLGAPLPIRIPTRPE